MQRGWPCIIPRALVVWITGAFRTWTSAKRLSSAPRAPPPAKITGRLAAFSKAAALVRLAAGGSALAVGAAGLGSAAQGKGITSVGTSICTGPGRPAVKSAKAQSSVGPTSCGSVIWRDGQSARTKAPWSGNSCSRPKPRPRLSRRLTPEMISTGTESSRLCAMAVSALVRPGPVITKATPGFPVTRA